MNWNCKLDLATMRAQISLAFMVLMIFALMNLAILIIVGVRHVELSGAALTLVTTGLTASITLAGTVVAYFFNRHRTQSGADADGDTSTPIPPPPAAKS